MRCRHGPDLSYLVDVRFYECDRRGNAGKDLGYAYSPPFKIKSRLRKNGMSSAERLRQEHQVRGGGTPTKKRKARPEAFLIAGKDAEIKRLKAALEASEAHNKDLLADNMRLHSMVTLTSDSESVATAGVDTGGGASAGAGAGAGGTWGGFASLFEAPGIGMGAGAGAGAGAAADGASFTGLESLPLHLQ